MKQESKRNRNPQPYVKKVKDIWIEYSKKLLAENPGSWGRYLKHIPNYYVFIRKGNMNKELMSYPRFRKILETYYYEAQEFIIYGRSLSFGSKLGNIAGHCIERNYKKKTIDWKRTHELWKLKGERKGAVFFFDEDWVRIGWTRSNKIKNMYLYEFDPARGTDENKVKNFVTRFSEANMLNKGLKKKYKQFEHIPPVKEDSDDN